jgi:2,4-dienoyl-CoA reductase-like NADH-dependent reductase (Old Yellow Enzyme family)
MARGGAGLVIVEATGVSPEGRISPDCTGLWNDAQIEGMSRIAAGIKAAGAVPGIQIGHAGRKASANNPLGRRRPYCRRRCPRLAADCAIGHRLWRRSAACAPRYDAGGHRPRAGDFVAAARRALAAGLAGLHFAHGYLAQSFFSAHSNQRDDAYGGSFSNRARFLLETVAKVREVWPEHLPLTARFGVIEYDGRDEETLEESIAVTRQMRERGLDLLNVSVNFVIPDVKIPWGTPSWLPLPSA